jgi:hypothetical protein
MPSTDKSTPPTNQPNITAASPPQRSRKGKKKGWKRQLPSILILTPQRRQPPKKKTRAIKYVKAAIKTCPFSSPSLLTTPHHSHHAHKLISKPLLRARSQVLLGIQDDTLKLARRNVLERALKVFPRHLGSAAIARRKVRVYQLDQPIEVLDRDLLGCH